MLRETEQPAPRATMPKGAEHHDVPPAPGASGPRAKEFSAVSDQSIADLLGKDASKAVRFAGSPQALYERHLIFDQITDPRSAGTRERFEAVARSLRDLLSQRWL